MTATGDAMFDPAKLRDYLRGNIPLAAAMQVDVLSAGEDTVRIGAPLAPNINHRDTAFGGSVAALAILASWSLLHLRLRAAGVASQLVIQRGSVDYDRPIAGAFSARATLRAAADWQPFVNGLQRRGKARIAVLAALEYEGTVAGRFHGDFVALAAQDRKR